MSITDELRHEVAEYPFRDNRDFALFEAVADRIDAEHQKAMDEWKARNGQMWLKGYREYRAEIAEGNDAVAYDLEASGWVRLPVDADGVPIRPGDELVIFETGEHIRAYDVELYDDGRWLVCDDETMVSIHPDRLRHRAPTVEDVLYDSLKHFGAVEERTPEVEEWLHEQAAKLRLAGEGE